MRVATCTHQPIQVLIVFASAHSRGLRRRLTPESKVHPLLCHSAFVRVATFQRVHVADNVDSLPQRIRAGCDCPTRKQRIQRTSLPQRIRAGCDYICMVFQQCTLLCHSAFVRVATRSRLNPPLNSPLCHSAFVRVATLRQSARSGSIDLCHSAFVRVATTELGYIKANTDLCHSAFVRVATEDDKNKNAVGHFATAHSCGLRL